MTTTYYKSEERCPNIVVCAKDYDKLVAEKQKLIQDIDAIKLAFHRQADSMAFVINNVEMPDRWYDKFQKELAEDREIVKKK